ncbi:MAG: LptE family protein [Acidobacteria bacterium]|nr:LptE family protein [Acidobacteriota bacterium]
MNRVRSFVSLVVFVVLALSSAGCGYTLAGRGSFLPESIRTIGVPLFVNSTPVFDIERRLTERVRSEFIGRGRYRVIPEVAGADAVLTGEITSITLTPSSFNDQQQATRYAIVVTTRLEFKDVQADKILWSNPSWQFREEYEVTNAEAASDVNAFFGQEANALDRIAQNFARAVVSAILEAF